MGSTYKGVYEPAVGETGWGTLVNANWTLLADAHITARSFFVEAHTASVPSADTTVYGLSAVPLPNAATTSAYSIFEMPQDATTATITVRPIWAPGVADASSHAVSWQLEIANVVGDLAAVGTSITWTGDSASRAVWNAVLETGRVTTQFTPAAGAMVRLRVARLGGGGTDTLNSDIYLLGVRIDYTAV